MKTELNLILNKTPFKTISLLLLCWLVMVLVNYYINTHIFYIGTRITFPMSVVYFSPLYLKGIFFAVCFLVFSSIVTYYHSTISKKNIILAYFIMIILGNLAQGSMHQSFLRSIVDTDFQYYHDAILIDNGKVFLSQFNEIQQDLKMHSKTHPPFTVWIHYFFLKLTNNSPIGLAYGLSVLGLISVFPLLKILKLFNFSDAKRNLFVILFAAIPSINIYSIVSIDAIYLTFSLYFLYGLLYSIKTQKISFISIFYMFLGFTFSNMISFGGTFLVCVSVIASIYQWRKKKEIATLTNSIIVGLLFGIMMILFYTLLNYNHIEGFFTASRLENPRGFRGFDEPRIYFFTRIENISEIILFLSLGFFAFLLQPSKLYLKKTDVNYYLPLIALFSLVLMFVAGAYCTGETARACIFIYPYLLLFLFNVRDYNILKTITYLAIFQTFGMQMLGDYLW